MMDRTELHRKIRALRQKTVENGCTEAEAMAAAEKVAELLDAHTIRPEEMDIERETYESSAGVRSIRSRLWPLIAYCTSTVSVVCGRSVDFLGIDPWPTVAIYLMDVCNTAIDREIELFKRRRSEVAHQRAVTFANDHLPNTPVRHGNRKTRFSAAAWQGRKAGHRMNIGHGIDGADERREIASR